MISGEYLAIQSVSVGTPVQLVLGQDRRVRQIYQIGQFGFDFEVPTQTVITLAVFITGVGSILYVVNQTQDGLTLTAYRLNIPGRCCPTDTTVTTTLWSASTACFNPTNIQLVGGDGGIFLMFYSSNIVTLPNGVTLPGIPQAALQRYSPVNGRVLNWTVLQGDPAVKITYDPGLSLAVLYGSTQENIILGTVTVFAPNPPALYSYVIILNASLGVQRSIAEPGITISLLSSYGGNIAYIQALELIYHSADGTVNWIAQLMNITPYILLVLPNGVFIVGVGGTISTFTPNGVLLSNLAIVLPGTFVTAVFAYSDNVVLTYILSKVGGDTPHNVLSEYNLFDLILTWRSEIDVDLNIIAGTTEWVSAGSAIAVDVYTKRLPRVIGIVREIIPVEDARNAELMSLEGSPSDVNLQQLTSIPVIVDFTVTPALAPLIPGAEYFLDSQRVINTTNTGRYLGTALNSIDFLISQSGEVNF